MKLKFSPKFFDMCLLIKFIIISVTAFKVIVDLPSEIKWFEEILLNKNSFAFLIEMFSPCSVTSKLSSAMNLEIVFINAWMMSSLQVLGPIIKDK